MAQFEFDCEKAAKRVSLYSELAVRAAEGILRVGRESEESEALHTNLEWWASMLEYLTGEPKADMIQWAMTEAHNNAKAGA